MGMFDTLMGADAATVPEGPVAGNAPNAFERVFNPDKQGTLTGLIGQSFGIRGAAERQGEVEADALKQLSQGVENGLTPQQSILKYVQSPSGQAMMSSGTSDFTGIMQKFTALVTPPKPDIKDATAGSDVYSTSQGPGGTWNTNKIGSVPAKEGTARPLNDQYVKGSPGETLFERAPDGSLRKAASVAPTDLQNFQGFVDLSKLNAEDIAEVAGMHARPEQARGVIERAVQKLMATGKLSQDDGYGLLSGAFEIKEVKNSYDEGTGQFQIVNKANGQSRIFAPTGSINAGPRGAQAVPGQAVPGQSAPQGGKFAGKPTDQTPLEQPATGEMGTIANRGAPGKTAGILGRANDMPSISGGEKGDRGVFKSDMMLGAGPMPLAASAINTASEALDANSGNRPGQLADARRNGLQNVKTAVLSLREQAASLGLSNKVVEDAVNNVMSLGTLTSAPQAIRTAMNLIKTVKTEMASNQTIAGNLNLSHSERNKAQNRYDAWERVQRTLPSLEETQDLEQRVRRGQSKTTSAADVMYGAFSTLPAAVNATNEFLGRRPADQRTPAKGGKQPKPATEEAGAKAPDLEAMTPQQLIDHMRTVPNSDPATLNRIKGLLEGYKAGAGGVPRGSEGGVGPGALPYDMESAPPTAQDWMRKPVAPNGVRPKPVSKNDNPDGGNRAANTAVRTSGPQPQATENLGKGKWQHYPTIPGAKMGSDGEWYVKGPTGQLMRLKFGYQ